MQKPPGWKKQWRDKGSPVLRLQVSVLLAGLLALSAATAAGAQTSPEQQVELLFAPWDRSNAPGAAVAVVQNGNIVFKRGYGLANLEYGVPIQPDTVFDIASMSKQFGAFSILLLKAGGRLSLDDDVRRYIAELHDFGETITLRHLLHHTSGIRDWVATLAIGGWRMDDVISFRQIINMALRQRELNFKPGAEYTYSNTGYNLLAEVVQRVTGQKYRIWTRDHIFEPLGMRSTHFHDHHRRVVPGRAYSYVPDGQGGYLKAVENLTALASSSLYTTVEDLALWVRNFETAEVGGQRVIESMQQRGVLNSGEQLDYAMGQILGEYRGLRTVSHGGSWGGFRTHLLRFPGERLAVIILSNLSTFRAVEMTKRVADVYLHGKLAPLSETESATPPQPAGQEESVQADNLTQYEGTYRSSELETAYRVVATEKGLTAQHIRLHPIRLRPVKRDEFEGPWPFNRVRFEREGDQIRAMLVSAGDRARNVRFERR